jgi:hypothetical protein
MYPSSKSPPEIVFAISVSEDLCRHLLQLLFLLANGLGYVHKDLDEHRVAPLSYSLLMLCLQDFLLLAEYNLLSLRIN